MEENKVKNTSSDEIDLSQLFRWIGNGFRNFGHSILYNLAQLRITFFNNKLLFGIIILTGLVLGATYSELLKKKFYKSSMIISCDYLNSRIVENTIDKLNNLAKEQARTGLAEELNIDLPTAKTILDFSAKPFVSEKDRVEIEVLKEQLNNLAADKKDLVNKVISKIEIENKNAFLIEVTVFDPEIIKNLEQALVNYIRNNNYVKSRADINRSNLQDRKAKLIRESRKLDSLKTVLFENLQSMAKQTRQGDGAGGLILNDKYKADALEVFTKDLDLYGQLQSIEYELSVKPDFEVIDGLTSFKEPDSASLSKILAISFLVSMLAGYLIIGLWKFDRYLASLTKE